MRRSSKIYTIREDLRPLLKKAKRLFPTLLGHVKTKRIFLCSVTARKMRHVARIGPNRKPWSLLIPEYDYSIEFWANKYDNASRAVRMFVMVHELRHIPQNGFIKGAKDYRKTLTHDIQDFKDLRSIYGINLENVTDIFKGEKVFLEKRKNRKVVSFPQRQEVS